MKGCVCIKIYFVTLISFFAIDLVWLGFVAKNVYQKYLGYLLSPKPNWTAAIIFYLIFIYGLVYFVVGPALENGSFKQAIISGLLFGFITYATYDLTNLATIKDWPIFITVIDLIWGSVLCGSVSALSYFIMTKLN